MEVNIIAIVTLACCILHNFCEIYSNQVLLLEDANQYLDYFVEVRRGAMRLSGNDGGGKIVSEQMKAAIFES